MKKKIFSAVTTLLLSCYFALAQNGGIPVGLKPFNPPTKPPFGGISPPEDTLVKTNPKSIKIEETYFDCYFSSSI